MPNVTLTALQQIVTTKGPSTVCPIQRTKGEALPPSEALNSVSNLVLQKFNQTVCWTDIFSSVQAQGELLFHKVFPEGSEV